MSAPFCVRETEVAAAARRGAWTAELRAHAAGCDACGEALIVASFLSERVAAIEGADPRPAHDAGLLWWRARIQARREAAERAVRPIAVAERAAWFGAAVAGAALLAWFEPQVLGLLARVADLHFAAPAPPATAGSSGAWGVTIAFLLSFFPALLALSVLRSARAES